MQRQSLYAAVRQGYRRLLLFMPIFVRLALQLKPFA